MCVPASCVCSSVQCPVGSDGRERESNRLNMHSHTHTPSLSQNSVLYYCPRANLNYNLCLSFYNDGWCCRVRRDEHLEFSALERKVSCVVCVLPNFGISSSECANKFYFKRIYGAPFSDVISAQLERVKCGTKLRWC